MILSKYKFKHFFLNKYLVSLFKKERYHLTYDYKHKALWFRTYKVASRTIDDKLKADNKGYIYASSMSYIPWMFKNYFKFTFVRNPEHRFVSAWKDKVLRYNYFKLDDAEYERMKDLDYFISWAETLDIDKCDEHLRSQNSLIDLKNIDFVGKLENFDEDFKYVMQKLNIEHNDEIQQRNKGIKAEVELTDEQRQRIHKIYRKDFEIFYPDFKN